MKPFANRFVLLARYENDTLKGTKSKGKSDTPFQVSKHNEPQRKLSGEMYTLTNSVNVGRVGSLNEWTPVLDIARPRAFLLIKSMSFRRKIGLSRASLVLSFSRNFAIDSIPRFRERHQRSVFFPACYFPESLMNRCNLLIARVASCPAVRHSEML